MSKLKTPKDKKLASLKLDSRNVYGENDKSSRKAIPLRKRLSHQAVRRASKPVVSLGTCLSEDDLVSAEARILSKEIRAIRNRFRKRPDEPLGKVLAAKLTNEHPAFSRKRK